MEIPRQLPADVLDRAVLEARKEGFFAGLTSGLASAIIGQRLMGFSRNKTLVCGALTTVFAGYLFTQAFTDTAIAKVQAEKERLANSGLSTTGNSPPTSA